MRKRKEETLFKASGDPLGWNMNTLKYLTKIQDTDVLYASFVSEVCPSYNNSTKLQKGRFNVVQCTVFHHSIIL